MEVKNSVQQKLIELYLIMDSLEIKLESVVQLYIASIAENIMLSYIGEYKGVVSEETDMKSWIKVLTNNNVRITDELRQLLTKS